MSVAPFFFALFFISYVIQKLTNFLYVMIIFQLDETELYVTELKDHVIIQQENEDQMYNEEDVLNISTEENVADEDVNHLVDEEVRTNCTLNTNY